MVFLVLVDTEHLKLNSEHYAKTKKCILELLKKNEAMTFDEICDQLSVKEKFSEKDVKETIWKLLEEGKIAPDKQWKMKYVK